MCDLELHKCRCAVGDQKATRTVSFCETQESSPRDCRAGAQKQPTSFYLQQSCKVCCPRLGAIAHLGQGCVSADPSTFEARRLAAVRLRCDSFSPLCVACPTSPRITAASSHLLRLLLGSRPHSRADQRSASSADQCSTRWRLREEPHQCPCECRPIHAQFSKDHLRLSAVQVSLAVISRMRISVALTTREGTSSGHAMPRCACDSGPILTFFR